MKREKHFLVQGAIAFCKIWICALNTIYLQQWCTSQSLSSFLRDKKTPSSIFAWHSLTLVSAIDDHIQLRLDQGFPTFFAARTRLSGQSILSTPKKFLRYILLYKRYIRCSVSQGSSYPLMFNLVPLDVQSRTPWCSISYPLGVRVPPVGNPWFRPNTRAAAYVAKPLFAWFNFFCEDVILTSACAQFFIWLYSLHISACAHLLKKR